MNFSAKLDRCYSAMIVRPHERTPDRGATVIICTSLAAMDEARAREIKKK